MNSQVSLDELLAERQELFDSLMEMRKVVVQLQTSLSAEQARSRALQSTLASRVEQSHPVADKEPSSDISPPKRRQLEWRRRLPLKRLRYRKEALLLDRSVLFDAKWYLESYQDVAKAGISPALHYLLDGWKEGRDPGPLFSSRWYLETHEDVGRAGVNPLLHFVQSGASEGRIPAPGFATVPWMDSQKAMVYEYLANPSISFPGLASYDSSEPEVSIVILNLNKAYLTLQCLTSLWRHTTGHRYEIVVVDNGSAEADLRVLRCIKGPFNLIPLSVNRYFGEANNIGAESSKGGLLVFMNNDVVVTPGWLVPLAKELLEHPKCGAAGPKFVYPDGRLQEAGAYINGDGTAVQRGKGQDPSAHSYNIPRTADYVSAATVVVRRKEFMKVGGFDFRWEPAYYEDVDLCLKLLCLGLKTHYVPASTVIHYEGATSCGHGNNLQLHDIVEINRTKFVQRWEHFLATRTADEPPNFITPEQAESRPLGIEERRKVALFTPYDIIPGGGERYLLTLAGTLLDIYDVTLVTPHRYSYLRVSNVAHALGLSLSGLRLSVLAELPKSAVDIWIVMGNSIVPPIEPRGALNIFILQFPFPIDEEAITTARSWWGGYDFVAVYSLYARHHVLETAARHALSQQSIEVIYPPVSIANSGSAGDKRPGSILHVGRFFSGWHCKNQHLLIQAFREMLRRPGRRELELHLVGSLHPEPENREFYQQCQRLADGLPVHFHLDASPIDLIELYRTSSIYWHATGLGADLFAHPEKAEHFGISVVEAMASECIPIVFAKGGPAEIVEEGISGLLFHDIEELAFLTSMVVEEWNAESVQNMRSAAREKANTYDLSAFKAGWIQAINRRIS